MINIIINGCNGAMGQTLSKLIKIDNETEIVSGIDKLPNAKQNPYPVFSSLSECSVKADVIIDFSRPDALPEVIEYATNTNTPVVIATTGLSDDDLILVNKAANTIPIFVSSNMSIGINIMLELCRKAAKTFEDSFDIEIIEKHHNRKVDSPSGTALTLANGINNVLQNPKNLTYGRHGKSAKRSSDEIGIHAVRGGTIVGEHSVIYAGNNEVLELKHTAFSRDIFGQGAIQAGKYIVNKKNGLYAMEDMISDK